MVHSLEKGGYFAPCMGRNLQVHERSALLVFFLHSPIQAGRQSVFSCMKKVIHRLSHPLASSAFNPSNISHIYLFTSAGDFSPLQLARGFFSQPDPQQDYIINHYHGAKFLRVKLFSILKLSQFLFIFATGQES